MRSPGTIARLAAIPQSRDFRRQITECWCNDLYNSRYCYLPLFRQDDSDPATLINLYWIAPLNGLIRYGASSGDPEEPNPDWPDLSQVFVNSDRHNQYNAHRHPSLAQFYIFF